MKSSGTRRSFDPVAVGQAECAAWAAYYRHEWATFLRSALAMVSAGFGMGRLSHGARRLVRAAGQPGLGAVSGQPSRSWPGRYMRRFYQLVLDSGWGNLDPALAAELEVDWWRAHRAHQHGKASRQELVDALDALYPTSTRCRRGPCVTAAELRAAAMDHSDAWVQAGCDLADPLLAEERRALVASFSALREAVDRQAEQSSPASS